MISKTGIFSSTGGGRAPWNVVHARIDKSVDDIGDSTFYNCERLLTVVETHTMVSEKLRSGRSVGAHL